MSGHVHRRQAPAGIRHEGRRIHREVPGVDTAAHHPQRELRAGLALPPTVVRRRALLPTTGPWTAVYPHRRPRRSLVHQVRCAQKRAPAGRDAGDFAAVRRSDVGECTALRGFAQRRPRKVQARRSPRRSGCGLHLPGPSEKRLNATSAYQVFVPARLANNRCQPPRPRRARGNERGGGPRESRAIVIAGASWRGW